MLKLKALRIAPDQYDAKWEVERIEKLALEVNQDYPWEDHFSRSIN